MNRIPKAVYTKEFREEAVKLAETDGVGVSEAARQSSISMKTLANRIPAAKARETFGPERPRKELAYRGVQIGVRRIKRLRTKLGLRCEQKC